MERKRLYRRLMGALLGCCLLMGTACAQTVRGDLSARFADVPSIEHKGETYRLNQRVTSLLLIGADHDSGQAAQNTFYRSGGQADFLLLLAINDDDDTITPIQINRDTLAEITVLSIFGQEIGTMQTQIALAHAFGNGGERSCELTAKAVSGLLLDTVIDEYVSMSMDGIAVMNDLLGGIKVTLEDDFSAYDSAMTPGKTLRLQGVQAEYYVRQRYYVGDQTNQTRQLRQRAYIDAAAAMLGQRLRESQSYAAALYDGLEPYLVTGMSRGKLINLANKAASYTVLPIEEISGSLSKDQEGYFILTPDAQDILETVLRVFYHPLSL